MIGIYTITNIKNNKMYVGASNDINERLRIHAWELNNNRHGNRHLQAAWNLYKEKSFLCEILEECEEDMLAAIEHYWVNILQVRQDIYGYNIRPTHPDNKAKLSEESKNLMSQKLKGRTITKEWQDKINETKRIKKENGIITDYSERSKKTAKVKSIAVKQFDKDGNIIKYWKSMSEAARSGYSQPQISRACNGKLISHKDFIWRFHNDNFDKYSIKKKNKWDSINSK